MVFEEKVIKLGFKKVEDWFLPKTIRTARFMFMLDTNTPRKGAFFVHLYDDLRSYMMWLVNLGYLLVFSLFVFTLSLEKYSILFSSAIAFLLIPYTIYIIAIYYQFFSSVRTLRNGQVKEFSVVQSDCKSYFVNPDKYYVISKPYEYLDQTGNGIAEIVLEKNLVDLVFENHNSLHIICEGLYNGHKFGGIFVLGYRWQDIS